MEGEPRSKKRGRRLSKPKAPATLETVQEDQQPPLAMSQSQPTIQMSKFSAKHVKDQMMNQSSHVGRLYNLQRLLTMVQEGERRDSAAATSSDVMTMES